jgi:hypothetical protein
MVSVFMYTMYKDLGPNQGASREHIQRMTMIQKERDAALRKKLGEKNVPAFPMPLSTFMIWTPTLEELTVGNSQLCMIFVLKNESKEKDQCVVLSDGQVSPLYASEDDAYRAIYDIGGAKITVRSVRA